jgi:hypothetical protein
MHAFYLPPGQNPLAAITYPANPGIDPTSWEPTQRCGAGISCYAAGDFLTIASNPFAGATTPFLQKTGLGGDPCPSAGGVNDKLCQMFLQDPQNTPNAQSFKPNFVPIPKGANVSSLGKPVPPEAYGVAPGLKIGTPIPVHP